jgi:hypothetical protein
MRDRYELSLARRLTEYADARVRPFDPVGIATEIVGLATRRSTPLPLSRRPLAVSMRWIALAAAVSLALAGAVLLATGSHRITAPPVTTPSTASSPSASAAAGVDLRPAILMASWGLDFAGSGIDQQVSSQFPSGLGSSVTFTDGRFSGGTGMGGGCDSFAGTFTVHESELRLTFELLRQGCGQGSPQQIIERLVGTRRFELTKCTGPVVDASPGARTACGSLTLFPDSGIGLLIYRSR